MLVSKNMLLGNTVTIVTSYEKTGHIAALLKKKKKKKKRVKRRRIGEL